jgi:hypothetical protein
VFGVAGLGLYLSSLLGLNCTPKFDDACLTSEGLGAQNCTISGSDQQIPFACPADTFTLKLLSLPAEAMVEHGAWTYRMAGFLEDERVRLS